MRNIFVLTILLLGFIYVNLNIDAKETVSIYTSLEEGILDDSKEELDTRGNNVWKLAKKHSNYVYDNLFYKYNFDDSEYYLIDSARDDYKSLTREFAYDLYSQVRTICNGLSSDATEENIKKLLECYYMSRYLGFYEDYNNEDDLWNLQQEIYDKLMIFYNQSSGVKKELNNNTDIFYINTIFGNGEVYVPNDGLSGGKYKNILFTTTKDKITVGNIENFIMNVVRVATELTSPYLREDEKSDYSRIYVKIEGLNEKLCFYPTDRQFTVNDFEMCKHVTHKGIETCEEPKFYRYSIFAFDNTEYIIENGQITNLNFKSGNISGR